jgi:hypothetical protein
VNVGFPKQKQTQQNGSILWEYGKSFPSRVNKMPEIEMVWECIPGIVNWVTACNSHNKHTILQFDHHPGWLKTLSLFVIVPKN